MKAIEIDCKEGIGGVGDTLSLRDCYILTGLPLAEPSLHLEEQIDSNSFTSNHSLTMKFIDCDNQ